jgi:hypothetical protein
MTNISYFTPEQRGALASSIHEEVQSILSNEWEDILKAAVKKAGLPEFFTFDDDGEEELQEMWDLVHGEQFVDLTFSDEGRKLELNVEFADNA